MNEAVSPETRAARDRAIEDWIAAQVLEAARLPEFVEALSERLLADGVPLQRLHISRSALDPMFSGTGCTWEKGKGIDPQTYAHGDEALERWQTSPIKAMLDSGTLRMRRRLAGPEAQLDYPVLAEFRDAGATDWIAYAVPFVPDNNPTILRGMVLTIAVDHPEGLTPDTEALFDRIAPRVGGVVFRLTMVFSATALLDAYVGADPARRIVSGQVKRGDVVRLPAVLEVADLRGFTALSESTPPEQVIAALNDYLGAATDAVHERNGSVLKFLGDGLLAVFSLEERPEAEVCAAALEAAEATLAAVAALNESRRAKGEAALALDIALHLGEVLYGNVGSARRLDFTVIGPAVNQASRMEALCEPLGQHLLLSERFARACDRPLKPLGSHSLRGVAEPQRLYTVG